MNESTLNSGAAIGSEGRPYVLAGWLAIAMAVLFPLGFLMGFIQEIIAGRMAGGWFIPTFGTAEVIFLANTIISVYVYLRLRKLLNERYHYGGINILITLSIVWIILFMVESLAIKLIMIALWPMKDLTAMMIQAPVMVFNLLSIGVIDLFIGLRLISQKEKLGERFTAFAYITLIAAICELTLILTPIALILIPVSSVILGMIFLREKEEVEFI